MREPTQTDLEPTKPADVGPADVGPDDALVRAIADALEAKDADLARSLVAELKAPDLAAVIEWLDAEDRVELIQALGTSFDFEALSELDPEVRDQLSEALPNELLARAVTELETDDAAYVIESLDSADQAEVLAQIPRDERAALERALEFGEDTAGRLMQPEFVAVAPYWTVGQVIDYMRESDDLPDSFAEIFVVDPTFKVLGSLELSHVLRSKRETLVDAIMNRDRHVVQATEDQWDVAQRFRRYDLMSAPVVDANQRLVGVITVDDIVDVINEEAEADIKALAGVGEEDSVSASVKDTARSRVPWLVVNLGTAIVASLVIKLFDATIEQMVALAVLMPIVASMGGNAGTQTMTVTVRALATAKLGRINAYRVIAREAGVGLLNGLVLSVLMAAVVFIWFGSGKLGMVIAAAMIVNLLAAALAGILIPLGLHEAKLDPAPAAGVFVTMVTDVVGFFAFLGLASLWLV
jgi:magnesium transporter